MIKIKDDYDLFLEVNNFEYCLAGYSLDFIKSIAKNYKYHELIEKILQEKKENTKILKKSREELLCK